jgi:CheY-like chemotaxis protein
MPERRRVLLIDDNVDLTQNLAEILEDEGLEVETADGGSSGLQRLARGEYALVVTDMRMPGMNGLEVIRYIKQRWPALPVMVMTAFAHDELLEQARNEGALRVMVKGSHVEELTAWIARLAAAPSLILVVEDDDAMRTNLVEVLQEIEGVVPTPARDGATARKLVAARRPSGAVIDVRLPDADGLELARVLREIASSPDLPVLHITGHVDDVRAALQSLLSDDRVRFLEKPFATDVFLETVRTLLAHG